MEYDCVIIPDFGGFVANYASARIHPTQHTFEPPFKQIAFNKNLSTNDGLLANAVALDQNISFKEAAKWIEEEVLRLEIKLAKKEKVDIKDVGTFYYDVERNLQFNAATSVNYLLDSFGLTAFQSPAIKRDNFGERIEKQFVDRPAIPNPVKKRTKRKVWPVALLLPVVLAALLLPFRSSLMGNLKVANSNLFSISDAEKPSYIARSQSIGFDLLPEKKESLANASEAQNTIDYLALTNDISKAIPVKVDVPSVETTTAAPVVEVKQTGSVHYGDVTYYLIAGCFKEKINADALVNELIAKGFDAGIAGQNASGLYRVSYHSFTDKTSAEAAKAELMADNPGVWLFQN